MKRGLVLGKFMPLHNGHTSLIDFALKSCDELIVLICATNSEPISGTTRLNWLEQLYKDNVAVKPQLLVYDDSLLPNTSVSSQEVSKLWAEYLKQHLEQIDIFFSSEPYGSYMGEFMACEHQFFDIERTTTPISATQIRNAPFKYWEFLPAVVKPYYVKKICLYGTESTGKSTLTKRLAEYYQTAYVPEMARDILEHTNECQPHHLQQIAAHHADAINQTLMNADKILLVDTDINITRSYSRFLFDEELKVPDWIIEANQFDLYLYLDIDAPYVQDGTRLPKSERKLLNASHKQELVSRNIDFALLKGNWEDKFNEAIKLIDQLIASNS